MNWLSKHKSEYFDCSGDTWAKGYSVVILVIMLTAVPADSSAVTVLESCILQIIETAPDSMTIGEARAECNEKNMEKAEINTLDTAVNPAGVVEERLSTDDTNILKPFTLMAHNPNYILLAAHNFQGWSGEEFAGAFSQESIDFDDTEAQFQLSIKTPLAINIFNTGVDIFAAYTVRSFWQVYNHDISSPFRETNHEPETWLQMRPEWDFLGFKNMVNVLGISHQSNGKSGSLSRSWNRVYAGFGFERGNFAFMIKPWIRIEEDSETDDNPDLTDYLGHGEIGMAHKYKNNTFSLVSRNNLESGFSRGSIKLGWSFPLFGYNYLKGYVQYFSGYGESLIDYNQYVNRIGLGLLLTDFL